jgi:hypothetical protein
MTVREIFDEVLMRYVYAFTRPCHMCNESGKVCGDKTTQSPVPEGDVYVWRFAAKPCTRCDGNGTIIAGPYSNDIAACMMGECVRYVVLAREEARFDDMNEALDWVVEYMDALAKHTLKDPKAAAAVLEMIPRLLTPGEQADLVDPVASSALTQDELRVLGIDPRQVTDDASRKADDP